MAEANEKAMIELRDYQKKAIDDVFEYICNKSGNPVVIAPTGSGKSTTLASLVQQINQTRAVHVLTQIAEVVARNKDPYAHASEGTDRAGYGQT